MRNLIFFLITTIFIILGMNENLLSQQKYQQKNIENEFPPIEEIESEYGSVIFDEELEVELRLAELEQAIIEEDTDGFVEAFSDEYEGSSDSEPLEIIREFMDFFFDKMRQRPIQKPSGLVIPSTFDLNMNVVNIKNLNNLIKVSIILEFTALFSRDSVPISQNVEIFFHKKKNVWKIKRTNKLFLFLTKCLESFLPSRTVLKRYSILEINSSKISEEK